MLSSWVLAAEENNFNYPHHLTRGDDRKQLITLLLLLRLPPDCYILESATLVLDLKSSRFSTSTTHAPAALVSSSIVFSRRLFFGLLLHFFPSTFIFTAPQTTKNPIKRWLQAACCTCSLPWVACCRR